MEACRPVSRRSSLGGSTFAAPDQQPCRPSSSAKSKRHSWSFTNIGGSSRSRDVSPRRKDQAPCLSPSSSFVSRSRPSSQGTSLSAPRMPEPGPEPLPERPRSSHGFKLHLPLVSRNHPPRSSTLPTIMEQRGTFAAESLRSRVSASKTCKLWDGRTRTTVPWDGLHRVSFLFCKNLEETQTNCFDFRTITFGSKRAIAWSTSTAKANLAEELPSVCHWTKYKRLDSRPFSAYSTTK